MFEDFGGGIDFVRGSVLEGEEVFEVFAVEGEEEFGAADGLPFDGELNIERHVTLENIQGSFPFCAMPFL